MFSLFNFSGTNRYWFAFLFSLLCVHFINAQSTLTALQGGNDAYIDVTWQLDKNVCLTNNGTPYFDGVFVQLLADGQEVYTEVITDVSNIGTTYQNTYRHSVGPDQSNNYTLNVFVRGSGELRCSSNATGTTTAFQPPTIINISLAESPDSILITWQNNSKLSENFLVFRDGNLIANLEGTDVIGEQFTYRDGYDFNAENSIQNGVVYEYCIGTFSNLASNLQRVCDNGSTLDIGFTATDDNPTDVVELQWNDLSAFGDNIQMLRNGIIIRTISSDRTSYTDQSPINGLSSTYSLVLVRDNKTVVQVNDAGSVPRNGELSGKVVTEEELFPITGAQVAINATAGDSTVTATTLTDFAGCFTFAPIFYDRSAEFTITVTKSGQTFDENPQIITLNSANPVRNDLIFFQTNAYTENGTVEVSNFTATPTENQDKVELTWDYTPTANETTLFNLYRGSSLVARLNDANGTITTYTDLTGAPATALNYRLVAYQIDDANNEVAAKSLFTSAVFPVVAPANNLTATAQTAAGTVLLNWGSAHTSNNYAGFRLYRNNPGGTLTDAERIAELPAGTFTYTDRTGEPGVDFIYTITAFREVDGVDFESVATPETPATTTYPALAAPANFNLQAVTNGINIRWDVPAGLTKTYNFGGFYIYQKAATATEFTRIGEVGRGALPAPGQTITTFIDYTGVPGTNYEYKVTSYLQTPNALYEAESATEAITFPDIATVTNFTATPATGQIDLSWDNYATGFRNIDGLVIYRNGDSLTTVAAGSTTYADFVTNPPFTTDINYAIRAVRDDNGQRYYSAAATAAATPTAGTDNSPQIPTNVTASNNIPNHIKICWDYPVFIFAEFIIRREGVEIARLATDARAYYDYDAPKSDAVNYTVQAVFGTDASSEIKAVGRLKYFRTLSGRVQKAESGRGVANVRVELAADVNGTPYSVQTQTDAAGFYRVTDFPCFDGTVGVRVSNTNSDFTDDATANPTTTEIVTVTTAQDNYTLNFTDYYEIPFAAEDIAQILAVTATADPVQMGILINWSPSNPNYTGFEIKRGTAPIAEILKGEPLVYLDTKGTPGFGYSYSVRAFWDTANGRQFSAPAAGGAFFPILASPTNFTATPVPSQNVVVLAWSHPYNAHDAYLIKRNNVLIATVTPAEQLTVTDTTGIPGQLYDYTVEAVKGNVVSDPATVRLTYPTPDYPRNFTATTVAAENHVRLTWDYLLSAATGFEIFRDGQFIAQIDNSENAYRDTFGLPGVQHTYRVEAYIVREEERYNSRSDITAMANFPALVAPVSLDVITDLQNGQTQFQFLYPHRGADGFYVYRDGTRVDEIFNRNYRPDELKTYIDPTAAPGQTFTYGVEAYTVRETTLYQSTQAELTRQIPQPTVPVPDNFSATDGQFYNEIKLSWTYDQNVGIDGFEIRRNNVVIADVPAGRRRYTDIDNSGQPAGQQNAYSIRAYVTIAGNRTYSQSASDNGFAAIRFVDNSISATGGTGDKIGQAVAVDGEWMAVANETAIVKMYRFDGKEWNFHSNVTLVFNLTNITAIDLSGDLLIVGSPSYEGNKGASQIRRYSSSTDSWNFEYGDLGGNGQKRGTDVAIDGNHALIGSEGSVTYLEYVNGSWTNRGNIPRPNGTTFIFGTAISVEGNTLIVGDAAYNGSGSIFPPGGIFVYTLSGNNWVRESVVVVPDISFLFGTDVELSGNRLIGSDLDRAYIFTGSGSNWSQEREFNFGLDPSTDNENIVSVSLSGDLAVIGTDEDEGANNAGKGYVYRKIDNNWTQIKTLTAPTATANELYASQVAIDGNHIAIGAPGRSSNRGYFKTEKVYGSYLGSFTATTTSNDVGLNWSLSGGIQSEPGDIIKEFQIYRSDKSAPITTLSATRTSYTDTRDLIAGKSYTYRIAVVEKSNNLPADCLSAVGATSAIGELTGTVSTQNGNGAVADALVTVTAMVDGEFYTYSDATNSAGKFTISNVYIGDTEAIYTATVSKPDREFVALIDQATLTPSQSTDNSIAFLETTSFAITGVVQQEGNSCGLDSINVVLTTNFVNGSEQSTKKLTDAKGEYTFTIDPGRSDITSFELSIENFKITALDTPSPDTILYDFSSDDQVLYDDLNDLDFIETTNFTDNLTYPVNLQVENTCGATIGTAEWDIRVRTLDGCFDKIVTTNSDGFVQAELPALNYEMQVVGVNNQNVENLRVLSYFKTKRAKLNLLQLQIDSLSSSTNEEFEALTARTLVYHNAPQITLTSGFNRYLCDDPGDAAILQQGRDYSLNFRIQETHNGAKCGVGEGYIIVRNAARQVNPDVTEPVRLDYSADLNGFPTYQFTAGNPNLIEPHLYQLRVAYFSASDDFLGDLLIPVFVEGEAAVPGTDIIVDPTQGDQVQLPLFILRAPPGDGSSSSISKGETITKTLSIAKEKSGGLTTFAQAGFDISGVGATVKFDATPAGGNTNTEGVEYTITTTSDISTADLQTLNGRAADVVVGLGVAMQYGLVQELSVGECDTIFQTTRLGFSPNEVNTTWSYTIKQIEGVITGYRNDLDRVTAGTLVYQDADGTVLEKSAALERLNTYIENWEQVLRYHDVETLPHYTMCTRGKYSTLSPEYQKAIRDWQNDFCPRIGSYQGDNFIINDPSTIVWDNELVDAYNKANAAIRNLSDPTPTPDVLQNWLFDLNRDDYEDTEFDAEFGVAAQNFTFGGGTVRTESYEAARTSSKELKSNFNFSTNLGFSVDFKEEVNLVLAPLGVGITKKLVSTDIQTGGSVNFTFDLTENRTVAQNSSVGISYTLADDDPGDQFSVTVIQGAAPNHTPYFSLLGGRSSCPPEEGTIARDDVRLQIIDPETGAATQEASQYDIDPDGTATFLLKITNNSPFNEARDFVLYLNPNSNTDGAFVRLGGNVLGSQEYYGVEAGSDNSFILPLTIQRGFVSFNHSLTISIQALCQDGLIDAIATTSTIKVNTFFENPCTPITITQPNNNWVLNNTNSELVVAIRDYDPANPPLQEVRLQYRRINAGDEWDDIPLRHLQGLDANVTPADLQANNAQFANTQIPEYFFIWQLPNDDFVTYPDGEYEVRVVADCGNSETISNILSGRIARSGLRLFGNPEPSDGLWTVGDEISFSFNRNLNCTQLDDSDFVADNIKMTNLVTGQDVPFNVECFNNQLIFTTIEPMSNYDGERLEICLNGIQDITGNTLDEGVSWAFDVITQKLYWAEDTIRVALYAGEELNVNVRLENSTLVETVNGVQLQIEDGTAEDNWLTITPTGGFSVSPSGRSVTFTISAEELQTYSDDVIVTGLTGRAPSIHVEATVRARPPFWEVEDPTAFAQDMNIITNWKFSGANKPLSVDSLDRIAVFIDGQIRGSANIIQVGGQFFAAYLTVLGNAADADKSLEFRVWDADAGLMYQASPAEDITFSNDVIVGRTEAPEVLTVNKNRDLIRIIPLNQGWTWFSTNAQPGTGGINGFLQTLRNPAEGDIIKTDDAVAQYSAATGWYNPGMNALDDINTNKGYQIYLQNQPDTLYVAGAPAVVDNIPLNEGWNWVGYPLLESLPINTALNLTPVTEDDVIKTRRQETPAQSDIALYNATATEWQGTLNTLHPYDAYKIKINNGAGSNLFFNSQPSLNSADFAKNGSPIADPQDETTWVAPEFSYEYVMFITAEVESNGQISDDPNDRLAAFVGNDLRGVGNVTFIPQLNRYEVPLFIGANEVNENFAFYFYDASIDRVLNITEQLDFREEGYGTYPVPHPFRVALFQVEIDKTDTGCGNNATGSISLSVDGGIPPYFYNWSDDVTSQNRTNLAAGTYTVSITDTRNIPLIYEIEIDRVNTSIAAPTVTSSDPNNRVCQGGSMTLTANSTAADATFYWKDENDQVFSQESQIILNNLQQSRTLTVLSEVNGCFTEGTRVDIEVNRYINAEFSVDDRTPLVGEQAVIFTPNALINDVRYQWSFGDGTTSTEAVPSHTYTTSGTFSVALTTQDGNGCSNTFFRNQYIVTDRSRTICESALDSDGDGIKEDCDNCPYYPNFAQTDDNDNGKGNECDCNFYATDRNFLTISGTLESKRYVAAQNITSDGKVVSGYTELLAGNQITLEAGFSVEAGATFRAEISETGLENCQPLTEDDIDLRQSTAEELIPTPAADQLLVYPNPFNENTQIVYQLERSAVTEVAVFDVHGNVVKILQTKRLQSAGRIELELQATTLVAGIYYVRLITDGAVGQIQKIVKL